MRLKERTRKQLSFVFFFFNDTATTEIYTLSLHDALPISITDAPSICERIRSGLTAKPQSIAVRSEEHTSELQSPDHLVCRLLLEKKKKIFHSIKPTMKQRKERTYMSAVTN